MLGEITEKVTHVEKILNLIWLWKKIDLILFQFAAALEAVKMFGLESTQKLVAPPEFNRTSDHMYIYKDRLFK